MSIIKKILLSLTISLVFILGVINVSNAAYYNTKNLDVGQTLQIKASEYNKSNNIFCMEHKQSLLNTGTYKIVSNVKIEGTKSTDYKGKEIDNKINAKFAYILWSSKNVGKTIVKNAVWNVGGEWMKNVGRYHNGIESNFSNYVSGDIRTTQVEIDANDYVTKILKDKTKPSDKTDKSKITVMSFQKNNSQYYRIGPFKWEFGGDLTEIKAYDQDNKEIKNIQYSTIKSKKESYVKVNSIKSGQDFYISIPSNSGVSTISKLTGKIGVDEKTANIWFLKSQNEPTWGKIQNLIIVEPGEKKEQIETSFNYNVPLLGDLKIIKVDKENKNIKLNGVGFYIQNTDTKKYVAEENKQIKYVDSKEDAKEYCTENGEFTVKNLIVGNYKLYETKNPNDGYKEGLEIPVKVEAGQTAKNTFTVENEREFIKLSGYVWVDRISGKQSKRNNLYHDGEYDANDILLDGITVRLKDKTTNGAVKEATTSNGGAYQFTDVLIKDLDKYYIEFEYNGLTYQNVPAMLGKDNGSKSAEGDKARTEFNNGFAVVEGKDANTGITRDINGKEKHTLSYTRPENEHKSILNEGNYPIQATTEVTGYKIKEHYVPGQEEIKNINLGLYEREMPAIMLRKDVENVELSINGYNHVYEYGSNKLDDYTMEKDSNGFNVGVKFANEFIGTYKRAVYQPDYNYTAQNPDKDSKLNVYITYRIAMYNESTNLKARVNSILDYYDKNLILDKIGTGISKENGQILGNIETPIPDTTGDYNKIVIQSNTQLDPEKSGSIYVRFKLKDEEVLKAINKEEEKLTYINIAEVNSYSIFDMDGKVYAGIDKNSAPANATPGNETTYENDTERAPGIQLDVKGTRKLSGSVFLDESKGEVAQVRLGDGIYDTSKEHGIEGVKVTLTENKQGGQVYTATTDTNGNFTISDFIPGNYTLTYTWGDKTYNVKDYKGTIWTENNRNEKEQNGNNWYKVNTETRYSDAMDDWETRKNIDEDAGQDIKTMNSTTPEMALDVEVNSVYSVVPNVDEFVPEGYDIINVDFGIVERARQQLDINKRVKTFKVTLANGQVIVDAQVNYKADGTSELVGNKDNVTYMAPRTTTPTNGQLWLQLDNELIQGAKVQIGYEIIVKNNSEKDYDSEEYYKFGTEKGNVITIKPEGVYDYLDGTVLDPEKQAENGNWKVVSKEEYNNKYVSPTIVEKYFLDTIEKQAENGNDIDVYKWEVATKTYQEIYTEWYSEKTETRTVRDVKLDKKTILNNADLEKELEPGKQNDVSLYTSVTLANSNEIDLNNDAEITEVRKNKQSGRDVTPLTSTLIKPGQSVTVTPPTGENNNIVLIIATTVSALVLLGVGVFIIKRKAL